MSKNLVRNPLLLPRVCSTSSSLVTRINLNIKEITPCKDHQGSPAGQGRHWVARSRPCRPCLRRPRRRRWSWRRPPGWPRGWSRGWPPGWSGGTRPGSPPPPPPPPHQPGNNLTSQQAGLHPLFTLSTCHLTLTCPTSSTTTS